MSAKDIRQVKRRFTKVVRTMEAAKKIKMVMLPLTESLMQDNTQLH